MATVTPPPPPDPSTVETELQQMENDTLSQQGLDQINQLQTQQAQDKMQTLAQEATSWANTENTISKEYSDVSAAKMQQGADSAKATSDEAKQA